MTLVGRDKIAPAYDLVVAGSGFGSMFFVHGFMKRFPLARCLVLEWGSYRDQAWQIANQRNSDLDADQTFVRDPRQKPWIFTLGFGGGSNCWWGQSPRLAPSDFRLRTLYGVGEDWPLSYDDLEPFYVEAERIMNVAGSEDLAVHYPRSAPFPQPPHAMSSVDKVMQRAMPGHHFHTPTARLSRAVGRRGTCCNTSNCSFCPTEAKFTVLNGFEDLIASPRLDILTGARVVSVETQAGRATGLRYLCDGRETVARGDLVALGCNAIHTPHILQRSGLESPALGRYLHEKRFLSFEVFLDGLDNFDGGAPNPGFNTSLLDGAHRRTGGAAMVYFANHFTKFGLRQEFGRWRQTLPLEIYVEELPQATNRVFDDGSGRPRVEFAAFSEYCNRGVERVVAELPNMLKPLPVEKIVRHPDYPTAAHLQGTCRMGKDPATSVVDDRLVHHRVRNVMVLGTATWPSCATGNPSLTAAALSLRAAQRLAG